MLFQYHQVSQPYPV